MDKNTLVKVRNRDNGIVGYTIPELNNLNRNFQAGEVKEISINELIQLSYLPGGKEILTQYLVIENEEVLKEVLNVKVEPEYFYSDAEVKSLLEEGSLEELLDCLDFAPTSVIDMIKAYAVKYELNDVRKREAIFNKTGFNVSKAIEINRLDKEDEAEEAPKERRVAPTKKTEEGKERRVTQQSKYKIVS